MNGNETRFRGTLLDRVKPALRPLGFNVVGTATPEGYNALVPAEHRIERFFPEGKTLIVIGSGGTLLWEAFRAHRPVRASAPELAGHPLDAYTVEAVEGALTPLLRDARAAFRYLYPFRFRTEPVSFRHLAVAAGLGAGSLLGVLIHPVFGPWLALRAAAFVDAELFEPPAAQGFDPCASCGDKPCVVTCPGGAVHSPGGWDARSCAGHRTRFEQDCLESCHARWACPYGTEHRYGADQARYHQSRSLASLKAYAAAAANG